MVESSELARAAREQREVEERLRQERRETERIRRDDEERVRREQREEEKARREEQLKLMAEQRETERKNGEEENRAEEKERKERKEQLSMMMTTMQLKMLSSFASSMSGNCLKDQNKFVFLLIQSFQPILLILLLSLLHRLAPKPGSVAKMEQKTTFTFMHAARPRCVYTPDKLLVASLKYIKIQKNKTKGL